MNLYVDIFTDKYSDILSFLQTVSDFGFVMLDISGVDSRDSGEYICTAINQ